MHLLSLPRCCYQPYCCQQIVALPPQQVAWLEEDLKVGNVDVPAIACPACLPVCLSACLPVVEVCLAFLASALTAATSALLASLVSPLLQQSYHNAAWQLAIMPHRLEPSE